MSEVKPISKSNKAMSEVKPVHKSNLKLLSEFTSTENELFKPYPPNSKFGQFALDEGLEVLVEVEKYCDKRVAIMLRDYIRGNITLDDARRTILGFLPDGNQSISFGRGMMRTAMQIPDSHPGGQAKLIQLFGDVYRFLGPAARNQFGCYLHEYLERKFSFAPPVRCYILQT